MSDRPLELDFRTIDEPQPGDKWQRLYREYWPAYRKWFLKEGSRARPSLAVSVRALRDHMPELMPTFDRLVDLAGGSRRAARFLSLYRPTPSITGCSIAVWARDELALIRNYDFAPHLCDGVIARSDWSGTNPVVSLTDCLWGVLDGMNGHGLAVALAFGGRKVVGDGFSITLILRYMLETCSTVEEACAVAGRVPSHMAYNVTMIDAGGSYATAFLSPDRPAVIERRPVCVNHQGHVEWPAYEKASASVEREARLTDRLADPDRDLAALVDDFLEPPLYHTDFRRGRGTLYTAVYYPQQRRLEIIWRGHRWPLEIASIDERVYLADYEDRASGRGRSDEPHDKPHAERQGGTAESKRVDAIRRPG